MIPQDRDIPPSTSRSAYCFFPTEISKRFSPSHHSNTRVSFWVCGWPPKPAAGVGDLNEITAAPVRCSIGLYPLAREHPEFELSNQDGRQFHLERRCLSATSRCTDIIGRLPPITEPLWTWVTWRSRKTIKLVIINAYLNFEKKRATAKTFHLQDPVAESDFH